MTRLSKILLTALLALLSTPNVAAQVSTPPPPPPSETPRIEPPPFEPLRDEELQSPSSQLNLEEILAPYLAASPQPEAEPPGADSTPAPAHAAPPPPTRQTRIDAAGKEYKKTGIAPVVALPTAKVFPFGKEVPEVRCLPFRTCDLELQAGEVIDALVVGDPERWSSEVLFEGSEVKTPHVVLKPTDYDLRTSLLVVTSRRTYHVSLTSPVEDEIEEPASYQHHVAWWYPDEWIRRQREMEAQATAPTPPPSPVEQALALEELNFDYRLDVPRRRKRRLPWKPLAVFDDGTRTFLHLPRTARTRDLPVFLGHLPDGSTFPLHTQLDGDWIVIGEVLARIELALGTGKKRRSLTLINEAVEP